MTVCGKKILAGLLGLILTCLAGVAPAQQARDFSKIELETRRVSDGLYLLAGAGGNPGGIITVSAGADGVLLVDSQFAPMHQKIRDAVAKISPQPIRFLINTHLHGDHTEGNELMAKAGVLIIAHDNVRKRLMSQRSSPAANSRTPTLAQEALPAVTYSDSITFHFNGEEIYIVHPDPAHTDGDSVIHFRRANVIHVGDLPSSLRYPTFETGNGGSVHGMIAAAERILKMAGPDTKILSSHEPPVATVKDLQEQRDMLIVVRDRVLSGIRAGKTLEQVLASKPTAEFDGRREVGRTPVQFVTELYDDLSRK